MQQTTRGRPQDPQLQQQRKNQLLDAAMALLEQKSYRSITIRDIAQRAEMKSAMVSYYFGGKEGLFIALIERFADTNMLRMGSALDTDDPLKTFIQNTLTTMLASSPMMRLLADEMLSHEGPLRDRFIELMPGRVAKMLPQLLKGYQDKGLIRADADLKWAAFSLVSLLMTPFIVAPVREAAWSISNDNLASDAWATHIHTLFICGVQNHDH